jgi:prephenate dehydrogenase
METLVVGAGSMGRWAGRLVRDALDADLFFLDRDPGTARDAAATVGGRALEPDRPADADSETGVFGVVCVAVPIPVAAEAIERYGPLADETIVDVTGTMAGPVAAMAAIPGPERASLHPLFAPDGEPGNVPVVVEERGPTVEAMLSTLENRGNHVFETTPAEHDRAMETTQARAHAAVLAFGLAAESVPPEFHTPVSAQLAALTERVTGGDARVYEDIQTAFEGTEDVAEAARRIARQGDDSFEGIYHEAGRNITGNGRHEDDGERE